MRFDEAAHRWKHRILYAFAPDDEHPDFLAQRQMTADHTEGFLDRDLLFVEILKDGESRLGKEVLDTDSARTLRHSHHVDDERFVLVLVGKDGTEKARSTEPVPLPDVFEQIDQMPMRERELRQHARRQRRRG